MNPDSTVERFVWLPYLRRRRGIWDPHIELLDVQIPYQPVGSFFKSLVHLKLTVGLLPETKLKRSYIQITISPRWHISVLNPRPCTPRLMGVIVGLCCCHHKSFRAWRIRSHRTLDSRATAMCKKTASRIVIWCTLDAAMKVQIYEVCLRS